jgi:general stress protein 26
MLVATDRRVIFLDHKPGYTAFDELTYDVISGVKLTSAGFSAVTLHTRLGDYLIRFVNTRAANNFTHYIETKRLEEDGQRPLVHHPPVEDTEPKIAIQQIDQKAMHFLRSHDIGVLSTISRTGGLHGAVVYYLLDNNGLIYVLTKSETHKAHNTFANPQVALTAYNEDKMQTVQVQGTAEIEADQSIKDHVFANLVKPRQYGTEKRLPPVTQLKEGSFMAIKITPTEAIYTDFKPEQ